MGPQNKLHRPRGRQKRNEPTLSGHARAHCMAYELAKMGKLVCYIAERGGGRGRGAMVALPCKPATMIAMMLMMTTTGLALKRSRAAGGVGAPWPGGGMRWWSHRAMKPVPRKCQPYYYHGDSRRHGTGRRAAHRNLCTGVCFVSYGWYGMMLVCHGFSTISPRCCTSVQNMIGVVSKTRASVFYCLLLVVLVLRGLTCFTYCILCVYFSFQLALRYAGSYFELLRWCMCTPVGTMCRRIRARPDWPLISQFRRMAPSVNKVLSTNLFKVLLRFWSQKRKSMCTMRTSLKERFVCMQRLLFSCKMGFGASR